MAREYIPAMPDDPVLLAAIARVAVSHGHHDFSLKMALKSVMKLDPKDAREKFSGWGSAKLRKKLKKEVRRRVSAQPVLDQLSALLKRSRDATDQRNETVHEFWCALEGKQIIVDVDEEGRPWPTTDELTVISDALTTVADELNGARRSDG